MDKVNQSRWFAQELIRHVKNLNPRSHSPINILAGIIWILITGAQWSALPKNEFPPKSTCYYWYRKLSENMDFMILFKSVVKNNSNNHVNKNEESYIDAAFVESKSGGDKYGYGWKGKGSNIVLLLNKDSTPVTFLFESAKPHEIKHLETILEQIDKEQIPEKMIGDAAYDSDKHDKILGAKFGVELIAPHRSNRVNLTQDGRKLRRYKRRYKVEQFFAHLQNFRRIVTRYEKISQNFLNFLYLASACILTKRAAHLLNKAA
jgi:transposase